MCVFERKIQRKEEKGKERKKKFERETKHLSENGVKKERQSDKKKVSLNQLKILCLKDFWVENTLGNSIEV